jgi:ribonuclease HI
VERRSKEKLIPLEIYTDGSLKKMGQRSTFGGWAFYALREGNDFYHKSGSVAMTTNQRMELLAILEALKYAQGIRQKGEKVIIYSDSAYAINCYKQEWYVSWRTNGWQNSKNQPVANQDLWQEIIPFFDNFWYDFRKVEGHAGNYWNEQCDKLAQLEAETLKIHWRG